MPHAPPVADPTLRTRERMFFLTGGALLGLLMAEWLFLRVTAPAQANAVLAQVASQLLFGREAGIPIGLGAGGSAWIVFQFSVMQDLVEALLGYGVFLGVLSHQAERGTRLWAWFERMREAARRRVGPGRRWGGVGLFGFMLLPFMINGPLVGAVAGEVGGLPRRVIVTACIAAIAASAAVWTLLTTALITVAAKIPLLMGLLSSVLAVAVLTAVTLRERRATRLCAPAPSVLPAPST